MEDSMLDLARPSIAVAVLLWAMAALGAESQPPPFADGDVALGKTLVDADCIACHAQRFGGKAEEMYLRPEHKIRTPGQLLAQVRTCNVQLKKSYFPEEEEHIAAYLNSRYYKFKP
jgi:hypothetical protein